VVAVVPQEGSDAEKPGKETLGLGAQDAVAPKVAPAVMLHWTVKVTGTFAVVNVGGMLSTTFTVCENVLERHPSLAVQTLEKVYDD